MVSVSHVQLSGQDPSTTIASSLIVYEQDVAKASSLGAHIIIFPEFGLGGDFIDRATTLPFCGILPSLGTIACGSTHNNTFSILEQASCMAQKNRIVVVINTCQIIPCSSDNDSTCPSDGRYQFNTEIAVDETGALVAIYHKSHPFYINCFDTPDPFDVGMSPSFPSLCDTHTLFSFFSFSFSPLLFFFFFFFFFLSSFQSHSILHLEFNLGYSPASTLHSTLPLKLCSTRGYATMHTPPPSLTLPLLLPSKPGRENMNQVYPSSFLNSLWYN